MGKNHRIKYSEKRSSKKPIYQNWELVESFLMREAGDEEEDLEKDMNSIKECLMSALKMIPKSKFYTAATEIVTATQSELAVESTGTFKKVYIQAKDPGKGDLWADASPLNGIISLSWNQDSDDLVISLVCTSGAKSLINDENFQNWCRESDPESIRKSIKGKGYWDNGDKYVISDFLADGVPDPDVLSDIILKAINAAEFAIHIKNASPKKIKPSKSDSELDYWKKSNANNARNRALKAKRGYQSSMWTKNRYGVEGWGEYITKNAEEDEGHHKW